MKSERLRRFARHGLAAILLMASVTYLVHGLDTARLIESFSRFHPGLIGAALLLSWSAYGVLAFRLNYLSRGIPGVTKTIRSVLLALGMNNLLPAKAGEAAKIVHLHRVGGLSPGRAVGVVFQERIFDLFAVLLFALPAASTSESAAAPLTLAIASLGAVIGLTITRFFPRFVNRIINLLPFAGIRSTARDAARHLRKNLRARFLPGLMAYTLLLWLTYWVYFYFVLVIIAGLSLTPLQVLTVYVLGLLGYALPGAPGNVGVFEAAMVFALSLFGVEKTQALAAAVVIHMMQFIPTTIAGLLIAYRTGTTSDSTADLMTSK